MNDPLCDIYKTSYGGTMILMHDHNTGYRWLFDGVVIDHMKEMAKKDIIPDGTYSDAECALWDTFRR